MEVFDRFTEDNSQSLVCTVASVSPEKGLVGKPRGVTVCPHPTQEANVIHLDRPETGPPGSDLTTGVCKRFIRSGSVFLRTDTVGYNNVNIFDTSGVSKSFTRL